MTEPSFSHSGPTLLPAITNNWLGGVDIFRLFAAFGVVVIHAGVVVDGRLASGALTLSSFFDFVVPFFVVTSVVLALRSHQTSWRLWAKKHCFRLVVPYLIWTAIYCVLRVVRYKHDLLTAISDPLALLFLNGGGAIALYFIPLLIVGLTVARSLRASALGFPVLVVFGVLSYVALFFLYLSGNDFDLGRSRAFLVQFPEQGGGALRLFLALAGHAIYCLPHVFIGSVAMRLADRGRLGCLWFGGVVLFFMPLFANDAKSFLSHLRGDGALMMALALSAPLARLPTVPVELVRRAAAVSFGVFLSHQVVLQVLQLVARRFLPVDRFFGAGFVFIQTLFVCVLLFFAIDTLSRRSKLLGRIFAVR